MYTAYELLVGNTKRVNRKATKKIVIEEKGIDSDTEKAVSMSIIVLAEQNENMKRFYAIAFTSLLRQRRQLIAFAMALHTHILISHHPTNKGALNIKPRIVYAK